MEENILVDGEVREPLVVWHNTIIDGHHRWAIIQKHPEIPYKIKQMDFPDKWAAIVWMCRNQLGRRNISRQQKDYLLSQEYEAQCKTVGGSGENQYTRKVQSDGNHQIAKLGTRAAIAKEHGVSQYEVQKAVEFGRGLDEAERVSPGIRDSVLSGEVKASRATYTGWPLDYQGEKEFNDTITRAKSRCEEYAESRFPKHKGVKSWLVDDVHLLLSARGVS